MPYCSDVCQAAAVIGTPQAQGNALYSYPSPVYLTLFAVTCSYPGCTYPAIMYPAEHHWNYCSESHEQYVLVFDPLNVHSSRSLSSFARKGCIYCRRAHENGAGLCKGCGETAKQQAPTIIPVPMDHDAFWRGEALSIPGTDLGSFNP